MRNGRLASMTNVTSGHLSNRDTSSGPNSEFPIHFDMYMVSLAYYKCRDVVSATMYDRNVWKCLPRYIVYSLVGGREASIYMYVPIHAHSHTYAHAHAHTHAHARAHTHTHTCTRTHIVQCTARTAFAHANLLAVHCNYYVRKHVMHVHVHVVVHAYQC